MVSQFSPSNWLRIPTTFPLNQSSDRYIYIYYMFKMFKYLEVFCFFVSIPMGWLGWHMMTSDKFYVPSGWWSWVSPFPGMGKDGDNNLGQIHVLPDWEFITFLDQLLHGCLFNIMIPHVRHQYVFHYPYRIHVYMLYMVTFTINIPQMLAYHTWILWVIEDDQQTNRSINRGNPARRLSVADRRSLRRCWARTLWRAPRKRPGGLTTPEQGNLTTQLKGFNK